ncbi:MAG: hypothetical protein JRI94_03410 [Deltaproteobacteria bacterium]|nr:hypothetical protein [Deltaproteobacteria bacterium]MBW2032629.1 hypothetical protein [Deltaproteobacteria bacterium]
MADKLPETPGQIANIILEFNDLERELEGIVKEIDNIQEYVQDRYLGVIFSLSNIVKFINITCYYERNLLHHVISMDETCQKNYGYYNFNRVAMKREIIRDYIKRLLKGHEKITNRKVSVLFEKSLGIIHQSVDLIDKAVQVYDSKENGNLFDSTESEGIFKDGDRNGIGTVVFPSGEIYIGQCKGGVPLGYGTVTYPDGHKYQGEIENQTCSGQGTFTDLYGYKYEGEFKDDKYDGQGTLIDIDGNIYVGQWENGILISEKLEGGPYEHQASPKISVIMESGCRSIARSTINANRINFVIST